jgi:hypothetical protein
MATCETCGNAYERAFTITMDDKIHVFDSFECAITALAPTCEHCGVRILGDGIDADETEGMFCCAHCASSAGVSGARDHV